MEEVKLFRTWSSPFALRIVWALKLKGIEHETVYEDLADKSPEPLKYNPVHKKVPEDPLERATARFWAKFNDEQLALSVFRAYIGQGVEQKEAKEHALQNLEIVEKQLEGKKFFSGENFGFLDLAFGWIANYLNIFEEAAGIKLISKERFPLISQWKENFYDIPVIKESWPDREKLITKFRLMREYHISGAAAK